MGDADPKRKKRLKSFKFKICFVKSNTVKALKKSYISKLFLYEIYLFNFQATFHPWIRISDPHLNLDNCAGPDSHYNQMRIHVAG